MKKFKSKTNLIITIIALVECILLLALSTYSWIESSSSLRIANTDDAPLHITDKLNYVYEVDTEGKTVSLNSYFSETTFFRFGQASSADGKTMHFVREDGTYRVGDTTDYNTCYYNFDFEIHNSNSDPVLYFFNSEDIFTLDDRSSLPSEVTDEDLAKFLGAFRVSIAYGDLSTAIPAIYSKDGTAANTSAIGGAASTTSKKFSNHLYNINDSDSTKQTKNVFQCAGGSEANPVKTKVNIRIWFECNDANFKTLSNTVKSTLLGAKVDVNLEFGNSSSSFKTFTFNDYSTVTSADDTSGNKLYFYGNNRVFPMTVYSTDETTDDENTDGEDIVEGDDTQAEVTDNDHITWVTCDENGVPSSTIPDDILKLINSGSSSCYFYYGTESNYASATYKWYPSTVNYDNTDYVYNALSATKTSANAYTGVGTWDSVSKVLFSDKTTYLGANPYNAEAYKFLSVDHLYADYNGLTTAVKMLNTGEDDLYYSYLPDTDRANRSIKFYYTSDAYYNENAKVTWTANTNSNTAPTYTAVGYNSNLALSSITDSVSGVGTWEECTRYNFSTELVDAVALTNPTNVVRAYFTLDNVTQYIHLASYSSDPLLMFAYIPNDATNLSFCYEKTTEDARLATWDNVGSAADNYTYYATSIDGSSTGVWNALVVVDGTAENLLSFTLSDSTASGSLKYSTVSANSDLTDMTKIDDYRYITTNEAPFSDTLSNIYVKWTAYSSTSTIFDYTYTADDLNIGLHYLVITEAGSNT